MQNFPTLKTKVKELQLQPLQHKHLNFIVELLSNSDIQKTLFRTKTKISKEKQLKSLEKMYANPPKEITYVLTIKKLLSEKYIGYVKIKLIDWDVKSCYISIAIDTDTKYRGKGYAKACYESFFDYLFSLGFMKIYGRTYENNLATIKLNFATGFRFIGRQQQFVLFPNKQSLDALLFEKLNPALEENYPKRDALAIKKLTEYCKEIALAYENRSTPPDSVLDALRLLKADSTLLPATQLFIEEILTSDLQYKPCPTSRQDMKITVLRASRASHAKSIGLDYLALPLTPDQRVFEHELAEKIEKFELHDIENYLKAGAVTKANWEKLRPLFLGK
ncbi:MAG: GNAT family N-acetyltransferase [Patescibacteria group bacterium]